MKITGIEIGEYRQFKNIKFDFTYPEGHPKAGQPLEKVCFIGQSGTGKTTLLNLVEYLFRDLTLGLSSLKNKKPAKPKASFNDGEHIIYSVISKLNQREVLYNTLEIASTNDVSSWIENNSFYSDLIETDKLLIYIPDSIAAISSTLLDETNTNNSTEIVKSDSEIEIDKKKKTDEEIAWFRNLKGVKLTSLSSKALWKTLLKDIYDFDANSKEIAIKLIHDSSSFSTEKLIRELINWKLENPNPRIALAVNCLNPILKKLHLEVDTESNHAPIVVKNSRGIKIPSGVLSTGTKQLIMTVIPIYKFNTIDSVILFDEPERSLFPDIQRELIKHYTSLAPEAQFFFATHSPIIAASFEPCERFILYFNEEGEVECRKGVAPIGDDPNDLLSSDFGLNELMLDEGLKAYAEYRKLGVEIRNEKDPERQNKLIAKRAKLGDAYNF